MCHEPRRRYTPYQFAGNKPIWAIDLDGKEELIVIRWFDGDKYLGETVFRVSNAKQREPTKNKGGDMQIIEFDISQKQNFDKLVNTKDITSISNIIKTSEGTFKGEYFKTLQSANYKTYILSLKEEDNVPNRHYTLIEPKPITKTVMYDYDSKEPLDKKTLESIKRGLADDPERVIDITAYASSGNATNDPNYNKKLSQDRANTIKSYLIKNGVDKKRINTVTGAGATDKFSKGSNEENKAKNRRAKITLTYKKKEVEVNMKAIILIIFLNTYHFGFSQLISKSNTKTIFSKKGEKKVICYTFWLSFIYWGVILSLQENILNGYIIFISFSA